MTEAATIRRNPWPHLALLLVGCALLLRIAVPAGWMPQANATGVTLSWCADSGASGPAALREARMLLAKAIGKQAPAGHEDPDPPCAFAMAASPLVFAAPLALPLPQRRPEPVRHIRETTPGRGLAAPPARATGPPFLG
ncbi:hypothetical protein Q9Q95_07450 [Sphingomonas sp. DG1-23]|uniref:hypothetical protein n=1 Tax=Sphingomonas sp. DG1-23 TaxID=3068316 RepID=UPI00273F9262|nr:hypothetical protein [Sphingomonas sp. DG1-23]MDP5278754.1 hypothetical protein [Sphingomonas sp. DG1-23]